MAVKDRDKALEVYELREQGNSVYRIALIVSLSESTVKRWLAEPERFSPYPDEVAVMRSLEGEKSVYDNLSRIEREIFWERLSVHQLAKGGPQTEDQKDSNKYLNDLSERLGVSRTHMSKCMQEARKRKAV